MCICIYKVFDCFLLSLPAFTLFYSHSLFVFFLSFSFCLASDRLGVDSSVLSLQKLGILKKNSVLRFILIWLVYRNSYWFVMRVSLYLFHLWRRSSSESLFLWAYIIQLLFVSWVLCQTWCCLSLYFCF